MKSIGASWKEWKKRLKKEHYKRYLTNEERLAHCPDRVEPTHWKWLVTYWSSDEGQARTQRNKINRSKHRMAHTAGSRSFAQVREEERAKNLGGESPDRATLFITTHRKKDGSVVNEESAHVIEMIEELRATQTAESSQSSTARDDLLSQILGPEHPGRVRMMGLGPTASTLWGTRNTIAELRRETDELRRHMNERVEQLVEERMKEQMAKHLEQMEQRMTERITEQMEQRMTERITEQMMARMRDTMNSLATTDQTSGNVLNVEADSVSTPRDRPEAEGPQSKVPKN
ncbi:uncharacterized protein LOC131235061 [Magnolia sinica]|uniref:uncharacterized protein LOC131235061 n=1 Tax=Magnolia sinica TaxID=86752 RepID=UPI0026596C65|nr:uncharacterized protein LOC131235061 [Magnolia sinica]